MASLILRHRTVVLTSPLWVAGLLIVLQAVGGRELRNVVEFLTASPLR